MDDLRKFLPTGPNFAPFESFATFFAYLGGLILAIATLAAVGGLVINLAKLAFAALSSNAHKASESGKGVLVCFGLLIGFVALWGVIITVITNVGNQVS